VRDGKISRVEFDIDRDEAFEATGLRGALKVFEPASLTATER
jgi:hypothetical protein